MSEKVIYPINHIVSTPNKCFGKPRIDGTRITVQYLATLTDQPVEEVCADYNLTPAQVHAAWSFYYDHKEEIDARIEKSENRSVDNDTPLLRKLRASKTMQL